MSEDTSQVAPGGEGEVHECEEGQIWDGEKCVPMTEAEDKNVGPETPSLTEGLNLTKRIERTVKSYFDMIEKRLDKAIDEKLKKIVAEKEVDVEKQLRKSFGLDKDPVIHMSDLQRFSRKLQVETAKPGKKSPASPGVAGPEGNVDENKMAQSKAIESLMKEYGVKK